MKFENYSVVKCPMGIAIKPNNGDSDLEVTLTIENDILDVTLHAPDPSSAFLLRLSSSEDDWCEPVFQMQHSIKPVHDDWNSEDFKCDKCGEPLGADDLDECGDCHDKTQ